jgi:hypothetical protein
MSHHRPAVERAHDEANDEQYEKDEEQDFGHTRGEAGQAKKSEIVRHNRSQEKE